MSKIERDPSSNDQVHKPETRHWIDRKGPMLMGIAEADPENPDDPNAFRYDGSTDETLLRIIYADRVKNNRFRYPSVARDAHAVITNYLSLLDHPDLKGKFAYTRAVNLWQEMRQQNPRFKDMTDEELRAHLRTRIRPVEDTRPTNPYSLHYNESAPLTTEPINPPPSQSFEEVWNREDFFTHITSATPRPLGSKTGESSERTVRDAEERSRRSRQG
jgi:hypothetical protein